MEVEKSVAEVSYTVRIPQLLSHKELNEVFTADFPLTVNGLRTSWRLTFTPYLKDSGCDSEAPVNQNIGISLHCLKCNVNHPDIEIYCSVVGRDQHEKKLAQVSGNGLRWQGILVPRLALGIFKLLVDDQLTARLRFVVNGSDMSRAVPSIENLSRHLRELLKTGMYSDMEVITNEGTRLPAHRAILHARSSLLQKAEVTKRRGTDGTSTTVSLPETEATKVEFDVPKSETPINSTFGSVSSGYQSVTSSSPDSSHKSVPSPLSSPAKGHRSPTKISHVVTPSFRVSFAPQSMSSFTPTFIPCRTPPSKCRLNPSGTSPTKRFLTPDRISSSKRMNTPTASPLKRPIGSLEESTPCRKLYDQSPKDDPHPAAPRTNSPSVHRSRCSSTSVERTPLRELMHQRLGGSREELAVKVNMSATVTQQLLEWIYTGERKFITRTCKYFSR